MMLLIILAPIVLAAVALFASWIPAWSARILPVLGSATIAVAPLGEYWAPTPARICSTSS